MIGGLVGTEVSQYFYTSAANETFTVDAAQSIVVPGSTPWTPTLTRISNNLYKLAFTPNAAGVWVTAFTGNTSGFIFFGQWDVRTALDTSLLHSPPITDAITLYQGDDYDTDEGRQFSWALTGVSDLTGAVVTLSIVSRSPTISVVCTVANPGSATQTVSAELTKVQTASLPPGRLVGRYDISAVLANSHVETLARGMVDVAWDVPAP